METEIYGEDGRITSCYNCPADKFLTNILKDIISQVPEKKDKLMQGINDVLNNL